MTTLISVSQLTERIKNQLEPRFMGVKLQGEISNFKAQSSGHLYFSLKDANAQIQAVMFRGAASKLSSLPKDGDKVAVKGDLSVYAPRGNYQIVIRELAPLGVGDLLKQLHERKEKLKQLGFFKQENKMPLPRYPKSIGVVTSPTGAVIRDIIHVLKRRSHGFHLTLYPVKVQGDGSAEEIAQAIREFNREGRADVLIVGRGGGSLEDLWAFNEECVAQAIYDSKIPIISAVGHETDVSIADFVADYRAPTPSAAAEVAVKETEAQYEFLERAGKQIHFALSQLLKQCRYKVEGMMRQNILKSPYALLGTHTQKVDEYETRLKLVNLPGRIEDKRRALTHLASHLASVNPKNILKKGYCIPFAENSASVIMSAKQANKENQIELLFHDGKVKTTLSSQQTLF